MFRIPYTFLYPCLMHFQKVSVLYSPGIGFTAKSFNRYDTKSASASSNSSINRLLHLILSLQRNPFRIMYLRMVRQNRVLREDLLKIWMQQKKYVYMQNFQEPFKFLLQQEITHLTGQSLFMRELLSIFSLQLKPKVQWKHLILDRQSRRRFLVFGYS